MSAGNEPEFVTLDDAAKRLVISRFTLWRRLKELGIAVHVDPFNRRRRLVDWGDIDAIRRQRLPKNNNGVIDRAVTREAPPAET